MLTFDKEVLNIDFNTDILTEVVVSLKSMEAPVIFNPALHFSMRLVAFDNGSSANPSTRRPLVIRYSSTSRNRSTNMESSRRVD